MCVVPATTASGQYFGRNKVQYEDIDFRVLATPHFDIYYYESEREMASYAARMAERWYERLSQALQHTMSGRTPIVLYASHADFSHTTVAPGVLPEGVGGFTDHLKGRVVLPFSLGLRETDHVLGHELVHAFQRDIVQQQGRSMASLPLWYIEGMAEHLSLGELDANTAMWMRDAVESNQLPTLAQLSDPRWFPYRYGQALWSFLTEKYGHDLPSRSLKSRPRGGALARLTQTTRQSSSALSRQWHAAMRQTYGNRADDGGKPEQTVLIDRRAGGRLNLGPSLSPDGQLMVFLSERDKYSVDVFLADGQNGRLLRKILTIAGNGDFESLQFMESSGTWHPASTGFVLSALQGGRPVLAFVEMPSGTIRRVRPFADLDHIYDPAWSPDGQRVAFAALRGGKTDLFVLDLPTDTLQQLTDDPFADLQPAWSPDSASIAFTTDRFTTSLEHLTFGAYRLAAIDIESGDIRGLASIVGAKNIDPQWIGDDIYFIADPGGVSNVFRVAPSTGDIAQVSMEPTGVSGMTALSPALSVAASAERMAFSVYRQGAYEIRTMPIAAGREFVAQHVDAPEAQLTAAPEAAAFESRAYRPTLALNRISQPYLTAGGGALGGFFRAGVSFSFSDLLEQQQVYTAVQVGTAMRDFAVQTAYINQQARWTWGLAGAQLPAAFVRSRTSLTNGDGPIVREQTIVRQTHRQLTAMAAYPFSRSRRVEFSAGMHGIAFARELTTGLYSRADGSLIEEYDTRGAGAPSVTLFESSAAVVNDTAVHTATGPVLGGRSRLEVSPTVGEIDFVTVTADYRRYLMPVAPATIAFRLQHVGRYGAGAGDSRLLPLAWTVRDLVRGYLTRDAAPPACPGDAVDPCDALSDFTARRLAVANLEFRLPLVGPVGRISRASALPLDAIAFVDAGTFWSRRADLVRSPVTRTLISAGAGARLNAGGFVLELAAARRLTAQPLSEKGWAVAVNFRPGF